MIAEYHGGVSRPQPHIIWRLLRLAISYDVSGFNKLFFFTTQHMFPSLCVHVCRVAAETSEREADSVQCAAV